MVAHMLQRKSPGVHLTLIQEVPRRAVGEGTVRAVGAKIVGQLNSGPGIVRSAIVALTRPSPASGERFEEQGGSLRSFP
jgi:hypothetical protein